MDTAEIIALLTAPNASSAEAWKETSNIFIEEFVSSDKVFSPEELDLIIKAWFLKVSTDLEKLNFGFNGFRDLVKRTIMVLTKIEKSYPEQTALHNEVTQDILGLKICITNLVEKENTSHKIRLTLAQLLTFCLSREAEGLDKVDIRKGSPTYLKSALHPSIKSDVELIYKGIKKIVSVEDWFLSTAKEAPAFFSVISNDTQQTANHLMCFISTKCTSKQIVDYLEFLKIPDKEILKAVSQRLETENSGKKTENEQIIKELQFLEEYAVGLDKKILELAIKPSTANQSILNNTHKI